MNLHSQTEIRQLAEFLISREEKNLYSHQKKQRKRVISSSKHLLLNTSLCHVRHTQTHV